MGVEVELTRRRKITLPPRDFSRYPGNKLAAGIHRPPLLYLYLVMQDKVLQVNLINFENSNGNLTSKMAQKWKSEECF